MEISNCDNDLLIQLVIDRRDSHGRVLRTPSNACSIGAASTLAEAGAIERQLVLRLFINFCHKNGDIFFDFPGIVMKVVVNED